MKRKKIKNEEMNKKKYFKKTKIYQSKSCKVEEEKK